MWEKEKRWEWWFLGINNWKGVVIIEIKEIEGEVEFGGDLEFRLLNI